MKRLLLGAALVAGAACGQGTPARIHAGSSTTAPEGTTTTEAPTTTVLEPTTTTEAVVEPEPEPLPEPVATTVYVPPPTRRAPATTVAELPSPQGQSTRGSGACGGSLPPCSVMQVESGGDPSAVNYGGCGGRGCYGKWQFDPRTSQGLGYPGTMDQYPESVQDEAARRLWAGGSGCGNYPFTGEFPYGARCSS